MARKPGPLRMLAIDECRIEGAPRNPNFREPTSAGLFGGADNASLVGYESPAGRWPANVILTDPIFDGGIEGVVGGGETSSGLVRAGSLIAHDEGERRTYGDFGGMERVADTYGDSGTYSRFFLIPKADRGDREPALGRERAAQSLAGDGPLSQGTRGIAPGGPPVGTYETRPTRDRLNVHPTVKPVDLMRHLVRLVTPAGGIVLDPFLGSGTTAIAAEMEGFAWVGIEREAEYIAIAEARLNGTQRGLGLEMA